MERSPSAFLSADFGLCTCLVPWVQNQAKLIKAKHERINNNATDCLSRDKCARENDFRADLLKEHWSEFVVRLPASAGNVAEECLLGNADQVLERPGEFRSRAEEFSSCNSSGTRTMLSAHEMTSSVPDELQEPLSHPLLQKTCRTNVPSKGLDEG